MVSELRLAQMRREARQLGVAKSKGLPARAGVVAARGRAGQGQAPGIHLVESGIHLAGSGIHLTVSGIHLIRLMLA